MDKNTKTIQLKIKGMACAACVSSTEESLRQVPGVQEAAVNLATAGAAVTAREDVSEKALIKAVEDAGFTAQVVERNVIEAQESRFTIRQLTVALVFGALELYVGMSHMLPFPLWIPSFISMEEYPLRFALVQLLLTIPVLIAGRTFFFSGIKNLIKLHPNMDSLVTIGTGSAFLYSIYNTIRIPFDAHAVHNLYFESAAVVLALVLLGKFLEEKSKNSARSAISSLVTMIPDEATILEDGKERMLLSREIRVGDTVVVRPGDRIPVDGTVSKGGSFVDESLLTGESVPVYRSEGDAVSGGTINKDGLLHVSATSVGEDTAIAHIMNLVTSAQQRKAPVARLADRIAGVFVPVVCSIALLSAIIWALLGKDFPFLINVFISVLVVACPCALGLATPIAVMTGSGAGARSGILFRGGDVIEAAAHIDTVLFDKTGTITTGALKVQSVYAAPGYSEEELLQTAGCAEQGSAHPIALALLQYVKEAGLALAPYESHTANAGMGVVAQSKGETILAGTPRLLEQGGIASASLPPAPEGHTAIYVAKNGTFLGLIALSDTIKDESASAIALLHEMGIATAMVTGDNQSTAEVISKKAGIDRVLAGVLPQGKADEVARLKKEGCKIAMVGDGINDAPALMASDVGISVYGGTDAAADSAGILLMSDNIRSVPYALKLARKTMSVIRLNLFWAFLYNCIGIPIAAGVLYPITNTLLSPAFAGAAMALSSISVVLSSLRLTRYNPAKH